MLRDWDDAHPQRLASIFKAMQNVAPSQLADRKLFDFETLSLARDDTKRLFDGHHIQVGLADSLTQMTLPTQPAMQKFKRSEHEQIAKSSIDKKCATTQKIPTINPIIS